MTIGLFLYNYLNLKQLTESPPIGENCLYEEAKASLNKEATFFGKAIRA